MTANRRRGEISAELDGRDWRLCLTLGALAELEACYGAEDLGALVARFAGGKLAAGDLVRLIGAGLRGAGNAVSDEEVRAMRWAASFPWEAAITAGLGLLRLSPQAFWTMTPRELALALGVLTPPAAMAPRRADLEALMKDFPDIRRDTPHG